MSAAVSNRESGAGAMRHSYRPLSAHPHAARSHSSIETADIAPISSGLRKASLYVLSEKTQLKVNFMAGVRPTLITDWPGFILLFLTICYEFNNRRL